MPWAMPIPLLYFFDKNITLLIFGDFFNVSDC